MVYPNCPNGAQQFTCQDNNRFIVFFFKRKKFFIVICLLPNENFQ